MVVFGQHLWILTEDPDVFEQQVAEVGGVQDLQAVLVGLVELLPATIGELRRFGGRDVLGQPAAVLPVVHQAGEMAGRPALFIEVFHFDELLDQPDLVVRVQNGEVGFEADQLGVPPQDTRTDRVKGAEPGHALDAGANQVGDALLHFARRLVGEGDGEDFAAAGSVRGEDVGDARGEDASLAGAGAGQDQQRPIGRQHRVALLGIVALERGLVAAAELAGNRARRARPEALRLSCHGAARIWVCSHQSLYRRPSRRCIRAGQAAAGGHHGVV